MAIRFVLAEMANIKSSRTELINSITIRIHHDEYVVIVGIMSVRFFHWPYFACVSCE